MKVIKLTIEESLIGYFSTRDIAHQMLMYWRKEFYPPQEIDKINYQMSVVYIEEKSDDSIFA